MERGTCGAPGKARRDKLPAPAKKLAHRLAQLANSETSVHARIVIENGEWNLYVERTERLGEIDTI